MTTTATPVFGAVNATSSGMAGITLMNDQVGEVIADVMATKEGVKVTYLPSMIRLDAVTRMDFVYDELSEALGEEPGFFGANALPMVFCIFFISGIFCKASANRCIDAHSGSVWAHLADHAKSLHRCGQPDSGPYMSTGTRPSSV